MKPEERDARRAELIAKYRAFAEREGSVPGVEQFTKEAGESKSLWRGRLWLTWNSFLLEAGFAPNERTQATDSGSMLRYVADETRRLSRFPTVS